MRMDSKAMPTDDIDYSCHIKPQNLFTQSYRLYITSLVITVYVVFTVNSYSTASGTGTIGTGTIGTGIVYGSIYSSCKLTFKIILLPAVVYY